VNCIISTCKARSEHLAHGLSSWRAALPDWLPIVATADDPGAVGVVQRLCRGVPHILIEDSFDGWRKLRLLTQAVQSLPPEAERVVFFDADIVAVFGITDKWLRQDLCGAFIVPVYAPAPIYPHDFGVLLTEASVARQAFSLFEDLLGDWHGYGSEDVLIRVAHFLITGKMIEAPIAWAHIRHDWAARAASYEPGASARDQHRDNMARFDSIYPIVCQRAGHDPEDRRLLWRCLGSYPTFSNCGYL
jgi:hypothetical protein